MNNLQIQAEAIVVPENLDLLIKNTVKKRKKHKAYKNFLVFFIITILVYTATLGVCYASPVAAAEIQKLPIIGSLFSNFTDNDLKKASENGLTQIVEKQITNGDCTITVKEIYYDNAEISIGFFMTNYSIMQFNYEIYYNNNLISTGASGARTKDSDGNEMMLINMPINQTLPDKCDVVFSVSEIDGLKRVFNFDISLNSSTANGQSKEFAINESYNNDDITLLIRKVSFSPFGTTVCFEYTHPNNEDFEFQLIMENNKLISKNNSWYSEVNSDYTTEYGSAVFESVEDIPDELTFNVLEFTVDQLNKDNIILSAIFQLDN